MKRLLVAALVAASFSFNASADEASLRQSIEELLAQTRTEALVTHLRNQLDGQVQQMVDAVAGLDAKASMNDAQKAAVDKFVSGTSAVISESLDWGKLKDFMVKTYSDAYSEEEIKELTAFYRSPVGQKSIEKMPQITEASMANMRAQMQVMMPKLQQIGHDFSEEYKLASGVAEKPVAPAPSKKKAKK